MTNPSKTNPPLFVDLDGTLIGADTLWVSVRQLLAERPWYAIALPFMVLAGRAGFKRRIARCVTLDPASLPYRENVLAFLRAEKERGRTIILATAADHAVAAPVADHVGLFDSVMATDKGRNLKGPAKLAAILEFTKNGPFDYMGDSSADLPILKAADTAYLVHPTPGLTRDAKETSCRIGKIFE
jgi:phosphoserine phosphatase